MKAFKPDKLAHTGEKSSKFFLQSCLLIITYTQLAFSLEMIDQML